MENEEKLVAETKMEMLNADDVALLLKVSRATAYRMFKNPDFPSTVIVRRKYIMRNELEAYLERRTNKKFSIST